MAQVDPIAEVARRFVLNLRRVMKDDSIRSVADRAEIDRNTLRRVLAGESWPDMIVIAKLERAFGVDLWPGLSAQRAADRRDNTQRAR
jgi:transcriptional regulator with XRE-family HTH domain